MKGHTREKNTRTFRRYYVFNTEIIFLGKFSKQKARSKSYRMPNVNVFPP